MAKKEEEVTQEATTTEEITQEVAVETGTTEVSTHVDTPMGFEDEEAGDMIIPRVKVIQTLSPERKDGISSEGDIINSLTKEKVTGKVFIPVFKFNNNIDWRDRSDGGGMLCIARDGKLGEKSDGSHISCILCKRCDFDNSKQGKESLPKCTKYINFFGFFEGERMPIILSFAKTNYNEGKKLYSLAKVTMQNMWNNGYKLTEKLQAKNSNQWYICIATPVGKTSDEDRAFGLELYKMYRATIQSVKFDMDEASTESSSAPVNTDATEF